MRLWQLAQNASCAWATSRWRIVTASADTGGSAVLRFTGGGGTVWQRRMVRTNFPRSVGDEVVGWE